MLVTVVTMVKSKKIIIRCSKDLYKKWLIFIAENSDKFKCYSDALEYLLNSHKAPKVERY